MRKHKQKPLPLMESIEITDAAAEGVAIAKHNDMVIFVKNAVPGDIADLQVTRRKSNYREATAIKFHHLSDKRTEPICEHFGVCGGCKWQNMAYEHQLFYKQKQVSDNFKRIGKLDFSEISPILKSPETDFYRNKLEFTFSNKKWLTQEQVDSKQEFENRNALGFHIPKMFDKIIDVETCHLQGGYSNEIKNEVRKYALEKNLDFYDIKNQTGYLRNLIIRNTKKGELMVLLVFNYDDSEKHSLLLNHLKSKFPQITSLLYVINAKRNDTIFDLDVERFDGNDYIIEEMENLKFKVSAKSFFQTNSEQAYNLYKVAREFAAIKPHETVYDLYTGTGTIANFVAGNAKKVVGIEYIDQAIEDAKINSDLNKISNTVFYAGDMKDVLNDEFIIENGKPDVIITDPPRAGMHIDVVNKILDIAPERIVYVSCNPATQARDLALMNEKYNIEKIQPVDMFPHTHHVENVVLMRLR